MSREFLRTNNESLAQIRATFVKIQIFFQEIVFIGAPCIWARVDWQRDQWWLLFSSGTIFPSTVRTARLFPRSDIQQVIAGLAAKRYAPRRWNFDWAYIRKSAAHTQRCPTASPPSECFWSCSAGNGFIVVSATSGGRTASLTSWLDFQHRVSY